MMWFENAYDRALAAEHILETGQTETVCEGMRRTRLQVQSIGRSAVLMHRTHRMIYNRDTASVEPVETPFYQMHFSFLTPNGQEASSLIDFDTNYAYLKRASDYANHTPTRPAEDWQIWDEAMAAMDESLYARATALGWGAIARMVERKPIEQFVYLDAA